MLDIDLAEAISDTAHSLRDLAQRRLRYRNVVLVERLDRQINDDLDLLAELVKQAQEEIRS